jgi:MFS family permease
MTLESFFGFVSSYQTIFVENNLEGKDIRYQDVINNNLSIGNVMGIVLGLSIGVIYDTIGRKKPYMLGLLLTALSLGLYPTTTSVWMYFILNVLLQLFKATRWLPFIPDLVLEES